MTGGQGPLRPMPRSGSRRDQADEQEQERKCSYHGDEEDDGGPRRVSGGGLGPQPGNGFPGVTQRTLGLGAALGRKLRRLSAGRGELGGLALRWLTAAAAARCLASAAISAALGCGETAAGGGGGSNVGGGGGAGCGGWWRRRLWLRLRDRQRVGLQCRERGSRNEQAKAGCPEEPEHDRSGRSSCAPQTHDPPRGHSATLLEF